MSAIIFLSISIIIASLMLVIKINIYMDFNNFKMKVVLRVYSIKVLLINIDLVRLKYTINKSKKEHLVNLLIDKKQEYLILQIKKSILDKLYYDNIAFNTLIGFSDASIVANIIGCLDLTCRILEVFLRVKDKDVEFTFNNTPDFMEEKKLVNIKLKLYFTIFDMIFALIMSFYKRGKYVKQKR